jgi:uncharacterized protein YlxW (UPF0749 family)
MMDKTSPADVALPSAARIAKRATKMHDARWQVPILIASVLLGIVITMQFRHQRSLPPSNINLQLQAMNKYLETERNKLTADLTETREKVAKYEQALGTEDESLKLIKQALNEARMQAGLLPVHGPGIQVTLDDSLKKPGPDDDPYFFIVHDTDIQAIVNELWAAGAEAISVNDQRVVTSTSVRCVGPTVLVNSVKMTPPYVIHALGAPSTLETTLKMNGGVLASLEASRQKGVRIDITKENNLVVPEFKGSTVFRYAQTVDADK